MNKTKKYRFATSTKKFKNKSRKSSYSVDYIFFIFFEKNKNFIYSFSTERGSFSITTVSFITIG